MFFFKSEIDALIESFPYKKATLEDDLEDFELQTINGFDSLKHNGHYYLGLNSKNKIYLGLNSKKYNL